MAHGGASATAEDAHHSTGDRRTRLARSFSKIRTTPARGRRLACTTRPRTLHHHRLPALRPAFRADRRPGPTSIRAAAGGRC